MVMSTKLPTKRNKIVKARVDNDDENGEGIQNNFKKGFKYFYFFVWWIAGKASMSTKRTQVVNDIDGDGDDDED